MSGLAATAPARRFPMILGAVLVALVMVSTTPEAVAAPAPAPAPSPDTATATGASYGTPILGGVYNIAISALSGPAGENPHGTVSFDLLINRITHPQPFLISFAGPVTCLNVQGNTALLNADTADYGLATVELKDNGGGGGDNFRFGFGNAPASCSLFPSDTMADVPLEAGRAVVYDTEPFIVTSSVPEATGGAAYSATIQATGGITPYKFKLISGALPRGLRMNRYGAISGTPNPRIVGPNAYTFTVQVRDSNTKKAGGRQFDTKTFTLNLLAPAVGTQPTD